MNNANRTSIFSSILAGLAVGLLTAASGCASSSEEAPMGSPDAAPPLQVDPAGMYRVRSAYTLAATPPELAPLIAELSAATDAFDDPSAYLVDLVVAELPEGAPRSIATAVAPYLASYINGRVATYAPTLVPGLRALVTGAIRTATRFETIEDIAIPRGLVRGEASAADPVDGDLRRTLVGVRFGEVAIAFAEVGLPDVSEVARFTVAPASDRAPAQLSIASHELDVPYAAWFRLGFDRAVIPAVVPGATDLADALRALVDCPRLGALVAEVVGLGAPSLYAHACTAGLGVAARTIYERFPSAVDTRPYQLVLSGTAMVIDTDGNGAMDQLGDGAWTGRLDATTGTAIFHGTAR